MRTGAASAGRCRLARAGRPLKRYARRRRLEPAELDELAALLTPSERRAGTRAAVSALPAVGWFHPRQAARIMVAGGGAEVWAAGCPDAGATLIALSRRGCRALLIGERQPRFTAAAQGFRGRLYRYQGDPAEALWRLRWLALRRQPAHTVHAVLVEVFGLGLLIRGPAGIGKSELALELLARGHRLVADDCVELRRVAADCLLGEAPALLAGFLEVRGLGLLDVRAVFGAAACAPHARLDLVIDLQPRRRSPSAEARLDGTRDRLQLLGVTLPRLRLASPLGHNPAVTLEAASRDHWWRLAGHRAGAVLDDRQRLAMRRL